jgi:hypothetical protein
MALVHLEEIMITARWLDRITVVSKDRVPRAEDWIEQDKRYHRGDIDP